MRYIEIMKLAILSTIFLVACSGSGIDPIPQDQPPNTCGQYDCAHQGPHVLPPQADGGPTLDAAPEASPGPEVVQSFCGVMGADNKPVKYACVCDPTTATCDWTWDFLSPGSQQCGSTDPTHPEVPACPVGRACHMTFPDGTVKDGSCMCPEGAQEDGTGACFCPVGTQLIYGACQ